MEIHVLPTTAIRDNMKNKQATRTHTVSIQGVSQLTAKLAIPAGVMDTATWVSVQQCSDDDKFRKAVRVVVEYNYTPNRDVDWINDRFLELDKAMLRLHWRLIREKITTANRRWMDAIAVDPSMERKKCNRVRFSDV